MEKNRTYVDGILEHIASASGEIALRIKCSRKVDEYDNHKEREIPFQKGLWAAIDRKKLALSHHWTSFMEGDKVRLSRYIKDDDEYKNYDEDDDSDSYKLENLTLPKFTGLEALLPPEKHDKDLFSVALVGTLLHLGIRQSKNGKIVSVRIKCYKKVYTLINEKRQCRNTEEEFTEVIYGEIPSNELIENPDYEELALFKTGDKVELSKMIDGSYELENLIVQPFSCNKGAYETIWAL